MLAALTGARRGELCGLKWRDVDLHAGTVRITRSILDVAGRVEEMATKSHQERTIALGEPGMGLLRLHRRWKHARFGRDGDEGPLPTSAH
jgi:integrase